MKFFLFVLCLLLSPVVFGGVALDIQPVRVFLEHGEIRDSIVLKNNADSVVTVQIEPYLWEQKEGKDILLPTSQLLVMPPFFKLEAGETRRVRVGFKRKPPTAENERSFRLIMTQVIDQTKDASALGMVARVNMPVFYSENLLKPNLEWDFFRQPSGDFEIVLKNNGQSHERLSQLELLSSEGEVIVGRKNWNAYVLPGSQARIQFNQNEIGVQPVRIRARAKDGKTKEYPMSDVMF